MCDDFAGLAGGDVSTLLPHKILLLRLVKHFEEAIEIPEIDLR
jgi:hypothetical protein